MVNERIIPTLYFSLAPFIHAARFEKSIIILNSKTDQYISLIDEAASCFQYVVSHGFYKTEAEEYICADQSNTIHMSVEELTSWINYFLDNQYIVLGTQLTLLPSPLKDGGLIDYAWDMKQAWHPFSQASTFSIVEAFFMLKWVHKSMKNNGVKEIFDLINTNSQKKKLTDPSAEDIQKLSAAVDAASIVYWNKTFCFAWATTYVLLALKRGWDVRLAIGVQTNPFYAHAWAESLEVKVINDNPVVAEVLSIICTAPYRYE